MYRTTFFFLCCWFVLALSPAWAQQVPGFDSQTSRTLKREGNYWKFTGEAELRRGEMEFYADDIEVFYETNRITAVGNVVFSSAGNRIAADKMDFDYKAKTGTFYKASGSASMGERGDRSLFGSQEPDAYFYGETIEKLGPKKYRISKGGFTTCLQPTPRWEITSSTVILNLDDYAILRNSLLRVKGVPVLYLPMLYYPIQDDDRATGFLIPTYGTSTIRGQSLSNAFFWAINRSQDATFFHDWFAKTGQGTGAEYRYMLGAGSEGSARTYFLKEKETSYPTADGTGVTTFPGRRSYEIRAGVAQVLPYRLRARARVDYFSNVTVRQIYQQNIFDASQRQRAYGGNIAGAWRGYNLNATFDWREVFNGETSSILYGAAPRVSFGRSAKQIPGTPIYLQIAGEYVRSLYQERADEVVRVDRGLSRFDLTPSIRAPLSKLQFLTVNANAAWHTTYYSESLKNNVQVPESIVRRYFDMRTDIVGPVFTRIWNTPDNGFAEKFKHLIEPNFEFQRVTSIDNRDQIVLLYDGGDYVVGGTTRVTYGLSNRFIAKKRGEAPVPGSEPGGRSSGRSGEFLTVTVNQSYYSNDQASQFDQQYTTSFRGRAPSNFSPVSIGVRAQPTDRTRGDLRMEYDSQVGAFQSISANGTVAVRKWLDATAGWSQRRLALSTINPDQFQLDNFVNATANLRSERNSVGGTYSFNYDIGRGTLLQQRVIAYYNAQCCGIAIEYQTFNFPQFSRFPVPQDRRFNFSFTLAGIGTFMNPFGAFGAGGGRQ